MARDSDRRGRVLVVNDTQEILELFEDILGEMGLEVITMSYAPRELDRVHEANPDLIVIDFLMGDRELLGWQLLQKIRMDRQLETIPIIVCTGALKAVQEQQGYLTEQGIVVVLKPFLVHQLEDAVRHALEMPRSAARMRAEDDETTGRDRRRAGASAPRSSRDGD